MIEIGDIRQMSLHEKLLVMEALWEDIARKDDQVEVAQWHKDILDERENLIREGKAKFIDWEVAKEEIRKAVS